MSTASITLPPSGAATRATPRVWRAGLAASATWLAFLLGTLTAAGWAFTRPRQPGSRHAYGPWLLLGWLAATLIPLP